MFLNYDPVCDSFLRSVYLPFISFFALVVYEILRDNQFLRSSHFNRERRVVVLIGLSNNKTYLATTCIEPSCALYVDFLFFFLVFSIHLSLIYNPKKADGTDRKFRFSIIEKAD